MKQAKNLLLCLPCLVASFSSRPITTRTMVTATTIRRTTTRTIFTMCSSSFSSSSSSSVATSTRVPPHCRRNPPVVVRIPEVTWRTQVAEHQKRIRQLLLPGMMTISAPAPAVTSSPILLDEKFSWTALDSKNPVYNFLLEYYGIRGTKGVRRLARWSPDPELLLLQHRKQQEQDNSSSSNGNANNNDGTETIQHDGILLQGATEEDLVTGVLHLRGATLCPNNQGVFYSPGAFYNKGSIVDDSDVENNGDSVDDPSSSSSSSREATLRAIQPYLWYRSILEQTLTADPILHCHGLHEWAMQYHPKDAPPPPSAKFQRHLKFRPSVTRQVINETVERKGVSCTHVDALRYFAPAAGPLNHHGATLQRADQLRLEQPACVHAHMDLLKIALKLSPWLSARLLQDVLATALRARKLDVAASPYDATSYGVDVVPVETAQGRTEYKRQQMALMREAEPVRRALLKAYNDFLELAFDEDVLSEAATGTSKSSCTTVIADERFAQSTPGGMPWRKNLVLRRQRQQQEGKEGTPEQRILLPRRRP